MKMLSEKQEKMRDFAKKTSDKNNDDIEKMNNLRL